MSLLNTQQQAAVEHPSGPLLIMASPGSGKTRIVTYRAARILSQGATPHRVCLVTFTKKAAIEMRERLEKLVSKDAVKAMWIGTFHAICVRLLRSFPEDAARDGRKRDFSVYDEKDSLACIKAAIGELDLDPKAWSASEHQEIINGAKTEGLLWQNLPEDTEAAIVGKRIWARYEEITKHNNAFDFDDLLNVVMRLAETTTELGKMLQGKFSHVLVDEYQDTNAVQFRLIRALATATRNLTSVGDTKQAIYSFRKADIRNIRMFAEDYPDATVLDLPQNYRSTKNIVACYNSLLEESHVVTDNPYGDQVVIRSCSNDETEADYVVAGITAHLRAGVPKNEIAVLYRMHALSRAIEERLRNQGITYQVIGGQKFYQRRVVKDVLSYLRLLVNPASDIDFDRIINMPPRGLGPKAVDRIRESSRRAGKSLADGMQSALAEDGGKGKQQDNLRQFFFLLKQAREDLPTKGLAATVNYVLDASGYRTHLKKQLAKYDSERDSVKSEKVAQDMYNLEAAANAVAGYEARVSEPTLEGFLEEAALLSDVDNLKDGAVSLMTVHASKGLEMDAVFVVGCELGIFPLMHASTPEECDEEMRLAYVAFSRPRKWLTLTYAEQRLLHGKLIDTGPSKILYKLPADASTWRERGDGALSAASAALSPVERLRRGLR